MPPDQSSTDMCRYCPIHSVHVFYFSSTEYSVFILISRLLLFFAVQHCVLSRLPLRMAG